ncbi:hypothetical protein ES703_32491 [subsurface metagenome]
MRLDPTFGDRLILNFEMTNPLTALLQYTCWAERSNTTPFYCCAKLMPDYLNHLLVGEGALYLFDIMGKMTFEVRVIPIDTCYSREAFL